MTTASTLPSGIARSTSKQSPRCKVNSGNAGILQQQIPIALLQSLHGPLQRRDGLRIQPMRRSAPMKRTAIKRQGQRMKPASKKKAAWNRLYSIELARRFCLFPKCEKCRKAFAREGHHPYGRNGEWTLVFVMLCAACHHEIHFVSPNKAREQGWLCDTIKVSNTEAPAVTEAREWWEQNREALWPFKSV